MLRTIFLVINKTLGGGEREGIKEYWLEGTGNNIAGQKVPK